MTTGEKGFIKISIKIPLGIENPRILVLYPDGQVYKSERAGLF